MENGKSGSGPEWKVLSTWNHSGDRRNIGGSETGIRMTEVALKREKHGTRAGREVEETFGTKDVS